MSVKNIRCEEDHEGCAMFSADVWYNKKKLGRWSQSYMCGPDEFDFDESILDDAVEKYKNSDLVEPRYKDIYRARKKGSYIHKFHGFQNPTTIFVVGFVWFFDCSR